VNLDTKFVFDFRVLVMENKRKQRINETIKKLFWTKYIRHQQRQKLLGIIKWKHTNCTAVFPVQPRGLKVNKTL